ncbi:MAG TPA: kynureninase [Saprospiraceae bacterium]|nr:kynureninase [Saprospiraceae bacterium]
MHILEQKALELDSEDKLSVFRDQFLIPKHQGNDSIYLCGNSLGLQPISAAAAVGEVLDSWGKYGVEAHLEGNFPWMPYHEYLTKGMAEVVGAHPSEVVVMNSLTVNLHLMMVSFYRPQSGKFKILVEGGLFPSDRYAISSQVRYHGYDPADAILELNGTDDFISMEAIENCFSEHGDSIALVMIGGVNYYSGQYYDLPLITRLARRHNCMVGFDLAHGAGNIQPDLHNLGADFAVWCNYKYLNSGPGAIAGIFVHENHQNWQDNPRFEGWWGNDKGSRFKMDYNFDPIPGAEGWQLSNPPILAMAPIRASLDIFQAAGMNNLREKGKLLSAFLIECVQELEHHKLKIITPLDESQRGCQISIQMVEPNKSYFDGLTSKGVIADWREPDVIRVAPVPLYNSFHDIFKFYDILKNHRA